MVIALQVIQMLKEQMQGDVLLVRIWLNRFFTINDAVIAENRHAFPIQPADQTDNTRRVQKGKEKLLHRLRRTVHS